MGDRVVEILIKARDTTASVIGKFRRRMRAVRRVVRTVTRTIAASTAAIGAMALGLTKLGERGEKVNAVKRAFARITGDETAALQALRAAAQGTISDFELMSLANQAMTLGAADSVEQFAEMVEVSRALARAQGIDARRGLESLTIGLARQSPRILDNIGIQIQLGDATTFAARAMEQARQKAAEYTAATEPGTAATVRFQTAIANLRDRLAEFVAESPEVAKAFDFVTQIIDTVADSVASGEMDRMREVFEALGGVAGNAFMLAFQKTLAESLDMLDRAILPKFLEERIATPLGIFAGAAEANVQQLQGNIEAWLEVLGSLGRRPPPSGTPGTPDDGGALDALFGQLTGPGGTLTARTLPGITTHEGRRAFLARQGRGISLPEVEALHRGVPKAAEGFAEAGEIMVASMSSTAAAVIAGSEHIESSIVNMVTNILRSLPGVGGFAGAIIGGVGGIFGALLSRRRDPVPVRMADVDERAAAKLRDASREPLNITTIIEQGGVEIERIERVLEERQARNATVRYGSGARPLQGRGSG